MSRVAIIGSGLAAVSVARTLIKRGLKPVILDIGENLDNERQAVIDRLSHIAPEKWEDSDRNFVTTNSTIVNKDTLPMKLAFGSDYFYAKSKTNLQTETDGVLLPFSHAKGGFSVGWGATVLPPDDCDLQDWPIKNKEFKQYYKTALSGLPYSASNDRLSRYFPLFSDNFDPLKLTPGNAKLLEKMMNTFDESSDELTFGQARVLVQALDNNISSGCKYCGCCMSGCVYDCIYKSSQDIDQMVSCGLVDYVPNSAVDALAEKGKFVEITLTNKFQEIETLQFDRVFLAAGAVGSTRIMMRSNNMYDQDIYLRSTVGFVAPMLRRERAVTAWPIANTQPGLFLEYKVDKLSNHWVHTQLSTPNELVYAKLGMKFNSHGLLHSVKKRISEHLIIAHCNLHSDHSNGYFLKLVRSNSGNDKLITRREDIVEPKIAIKHALNRLSIIARKVGCYTMFPFVQDSIKTGGFHVGGTMPMKNNPMKMTDTNLFGTPMGWERLHIVDSSVFPSLPGTTIGLLAMANATRIASEVEL